MSNVKVFATQDGQMDRQMDRWTMAETAGGPDEYDWLHWSIYCCSYGPKIIIIFKCLHSSNDRLNHEYEPPIFSVL